MKTGRSQQKIKGAIQASNKPRPEIRDDMDSRHSKPENYKGDRGDKNEKKKQTGNKPQK